MDSDTLQQNKEIGIIQTLGQTKKHATAVNHLKKLKVEFENKIQGKKYLNCDSLTALRVRIWKSNPDARITSLNENFVTFEGIQLERVPDLPEGYAYKGGAARLALLELLNEPMGTRQPRDLDIVRIGKAENKNDDSIAQEYMPEDARFGHGIEVISSIDSYMSSRDLTLNEILYFQHKIICSLRCLQDTLSGTIRFTKSGRLQGRVFTKALRLQAESEIEGRHLRLDCKSTRINVTPFDIALHLERALERGSRVAEAYCKKCIEHDLIQARSSRVGDVTAALLDLEPSISKKCKKLRPKRSTKRKRFL